MMMHITRCFIALWAHDIIRSIGSISNCHELKSSICLLFIKIYMLIAYEKAVQWPSPILLVLIFSLLDSVSILGNFLSIRPWMDISSNLLI